MTKRKRWNFIGYILSIVFVLIILGVIYIAPSYSNELQIISRILLVVAFVGAFAIISKNIKRKCYKNIKHN